MDKIRGRGIWNVSYNDTDIPYCFLPEDRLNVVTGIIVAYTTRTIVLVVFFALVYMITDIHICNTAG